MNSISLRLSLLLACFISFTVGWVPRLENRRGRRAMVSQFAEANSAKDDYAVQEFMSTTLSESSILFNDLLFHPYIQVQGLLDIVSDRADELAAGTFGRNEQCTDIDCDQECLIPEEWIPTGEIDVTEVLRFLGIRRVT